jgi:hypothetical protein
MSKLHLDGTRSHWITWPSSVRDHPWIWADQSPEF